MNRLHVIGLILIAVLIAGLSLSIVYTDPKTFWRSVGFLLLGSAFGALMAIFVVNEVISHRQRLANDETRRRLLRSIGHDAVGAITRVFWGLRVAPQGRLTFKGHELNKAWYYYIETGMLSPGGFKNEVYTQHVKAVYPEPAGQKPPPRRVVLTNDFIDFDIGLLMVTRALGRAYARLDLFEPTDLPVNDLEQAAQLLRDGKEKGALDDFQSASLLAALTQAVERCGLSLWQLKGFIKRESPHD